MRYPVGNTGSREEFERDWYIASGFGEPRKNSAGVVTYYHEGLDINLRTGGDTDLNKELKAIAPGKIVYYHNFHAGTPNTFGRHLVYRIDGAWGSRWIHYAHCSELDFHGAQQDVTEGQIIARIGKSGTTASHLHMGILKVDPTSIDNIANNLQELADLWEDPAAFINTWLAAPAPIPTPMPDIRLQLLDQAGITTESLTREAIERYNKWDQMMKDKENLQTNFNNLKQKIRTGVNTVIDLA